MKSEPPDLRETLDIAALLVLLLTIGGLGYWYFGVHSTNAKQIESIAVPPFQNESVKVDNEYLSYGMTESLIGSLSQISNLERAVQPQTG
jgi:hypothetical protein